MGSGSSTDAGGRSNRPMTSPNVGKTQLNGTTSIPSRPVQSASRAGRSRRDHDDSIFSKTKLPPPVPPKLRKKDIFKLSDYSYVDEHVLSGTNNLLLGSFKSLIDYLTGNEAYDEIAKARAIFRWVTSIDVYSLRTEVEPPTHSPLEYFMKIQNNMGNHAHLISGLCQMANLPCVIISGMNKSAAYEIGGKVDRKTMGAQWNAVYVNGDWRFIDAFWASACVVGKKSGEWTLVDADGNVVQNDEEAADGETQHRVNEFYFLPDPDCFIWTHFPDESNWQLMSKAVSLREFEEHVYIRERFHILGMTLLDKSKDKCMITAKDGTMEFGFSLPFRESEHYRFKYMLYQAKSGEINAIQLDRFVLYEHTADQLKFTLRFPIAGRFKMDIFGLDTRESDVFDLTCTYVISCAEPQKNCMPLPDCPQIGWGPGADAKNAGITPKTHDGAIIVTEDGQVEIKLGSHKNVELFQLLKNTVVDEATLSRYAIVHENEKGEFTVEIRLPQGGEYALKLYCSDDGDSGVADNVLNYLIQCDNKNINNQPFPNLTDGRVGKKALADVLGVKAMSHTDGLVNADMGKAKIHFTAKNNLDLLAELHTLNPEARKRGRIDVREVNGKWTFDCDLPVEGEYSINIFARMKGNHPRIFNVHSYLVKSGGYVDPTESSEDEAKSVKTDSTESDIGNITETVQTSENEVFIPIPDLVDEVLASYQKCHANELPKEDELKKEKQDDVKVFKAKMEEFGEYMMDLYKRESGARVVKHIARYQINRKPASELFEDNAKLLMSRFGIGDDDDDAASEGDTDEERARKKARKTIIRAMELKDLNMLRKGIAAYENTNPPDVKKDPLLLRAKKILELLEAKEELNEASQKRELAALEAALERAKKANYDNILDLNIAMATRLRDQLQRIEKLRHAVLAMDQKTVSEIRTYGKPPNGVHQSLMATFILLGHSKKEVKEWKTCQSILGRKGKDSIMRKISEFDPRNCFLDVAQAADRALEGFTLENIRDVSAGAATFYVWSKGMIEVVENTGGAKVKEMAGGGNKQQAKSVPKPVISRPNTSKSKKN